MQCKSKISLKSCAWTHAVCKQVHTSLALNSSQSAFVLSIRIMETAVHCKREGFLSLSLRLMSVLYIDDCLFHLQTLTHSVILHSSHTT